MSLLSGGEQALTAIEAAWPSLVIDRGPGVQAVHATEHDRRSDGSVDADEPQKEE